MLFIPGTPRIYSFSFKLECGGIFSSEGTNLLTRRSCFRIRIPCTLVKPAKQYRAIATAILRRESSSIDGNENIWFLRLMIIVRERDR